MGREPAGHPGGGLAVSRQETGSRVAVTLAGRLDLDGVEELAACADQLCRGAVWAAVFDVAALTAVDDAGARTLAAACRCLSAHGVAVGVRGIGAPVRQVLDRLGLTLPDAPRPARRQTAAGRARHRAVLGGSPA